MKRRHWLLLALCLLLIAPAGLRAQETPAKRRAISLTVLQQSLRAAKGQPDPALLEMCGLTRVEGYALDGRARDLIIFGTVDPAAPKLYTQDFAVALRSAWGKYATRRGPTVVSTDPGCSLDPNPDTIRRLSQIAAGAPASDPEIESLLDRWRAVSQEPQKVRVEGVPFDSHFGKTMVDADYLMKRLVDGSVALGVPGFNSLIDAIAEESAAEMTRTGQITGTAASFNRFWFYPGRNRYGLDGNEVTLLECPVVLLTEEQYLTGRGISGRGRPDPRAQRFAESFTAHYAEIAAREPRYQQLEALFRFVALAKVMKYRRVPVDLSYLLDRFPVPRTEVPKTLPGVSRVKYVEQPHETEDGEETCRLWLPSCGGVRMAVKVKPSDFVQLSPRTPPSPKGPALPPTGKKPQPGKQSKPARASTPKRSRAVASRPSPKALYWDY